MKQKLEEWNPNLPLVKEKVKPKKRKKYTRKPKRFDRTPLGRSLKLHAPLEYDLIISTAGKEPDPEFIEAVSYSSINPWFRGSRFRRMLIDYRKFGCFKVTLLKEPTIEQIRRVQEKNRNQVLNLC